MSRAITITSGKGGVGKTNISLNLALHLSKNKYKTCLFDADLGLANINILLGLQPEQDLKDAILNGSPLRDIIIEGPEGLHILPGSSGVEELADLPSARVENMVRSFSALGGYDFLIFDTSAGISRNVVAFCLASPEVVLVITPEPTSLTDAFALLKILVANGYQGEAKIIMNQCKNAEVAKVVYKKFRSAALKYIKRDVTALGVVYEDPKVTEAVKNQKALLTLYPDSNASRCIGKIADRLTTGGEAFDQLDAEGFWRRCLDLFRLPLNLPRKESETGEKTADSTAPRKTDPADRKETDPHEAVPSTVEERGSRFESEGAQPEAAGSDQFHNREEGASSAGGSINLDQSFAPMMEKLIQSIQSVSKELQLVRKAISGNGNGKVSAQGGESAASAGLGPGAIRLDLEAFVKAREEQGD